MLQVVDFPSADGTEEHLMISSKPIDDVTKEIFLERLVKEIVEPFAPGRSNSKSRFVISKSSDEASKHQSKRETDNTTPAKRIWSKRIVMGINQCSKILQRAISSSSATRPYLCVCAGDTYPPTMLAHVPVITTQLKIPLLILGGKASLELGKAFGVRRVSILLLLPSDEDDPSHNVIASFCNYARSLL